MTALKSGFRYPGAWELVSGYLNLHGHNDEHFNGQVSVAVHKAARAGKYSPHSMAPYLRAVLKQILPARFFEVFKDRDELDLLIFDLSSLAIPYEDLRRHENQLLDAGEDISGDLTAYLVSITRYAAIAVGAWAASERLSEKDILNPLDPNLFQKFTRRWVCRTQPSDKSLNQCCELIAQGKSDQRCCSNNTLRKWLNEGLPKRKPPWKTIDKVFSRISELAEEQGHSGHPDLQWQARWVASWVLLQDRLNRLVDEHGLGPLMPGLARVFGITIRQTHVLLREETLVELELQTLIKLEKSRRPITLWLREYLLHQPFLLGLHPQTKDLGESNRIAALQRLAVLIRDDTAASRNLKDRIRERFLMRAMLPRRATPGVQFKLALLAGVPVLTNIQSGTTAAFEKTKEIRALEIGRLLWDRFLSNQDPSKLNQEERAMFDDLARDKLQRASRLMTLKVTDASLPEALLDAKTQLEREFRESCEDLPVDHPALEFRHLFELSKARSKAGEQLNTESVDEVLLSQLKRELKTTREVRAAKDYLLRKPDAARLAEFLSQVLWNPTPRANNKEARKYAKQAAEHGRHIWWMVIKP